MSELIISRRTLIKGLFVAPAIVAAVNIMPIKAIEKFTTADFDVDKSKWVLVKQRDGNILNWKKEAISEVSYEPFWIRSEQFNIFHLRDSMDVLKTTYLDAPVKHRNGWGDAITQLNKIVAADVTVMPLPSNMTKLESKSSNIIMPSWA